MAMTASLTVVNIPLIKPPISFVANDDLSANFLTSSATTAKPLPCSPALAASMAALSANRFVCEAISSIVSTILPISSERLPISSTFSAEAPTLALIFCMPLRVCSTVNVPFLAASAAVAESVVTDAAFPATCWMAAFICSVAFDTLRTELLCS